MNELGKHFGSRISSSFTVVVWDCMPKQVSHFISKVLTCLSFVIFGSFVWLAMVSLIIKEYTGFLVY